MHILTSLVLFSTLLLPSVLSQQDSDVQAPFQSDPDSNYDYDSPPPPPAADTDADGDAEVVTPKLVVAHHIVGNTYPYTKADWSRDIKLASSKGIDGFALNVGRDSWQPARVADAFAAASSSGTSFKLFLSFDMSSLPCGAPADANVLRTYIKSYAKHPNQMMYGGRVLVSTFAGEGCRFGGAGQGMDASASGGLDEAWRWALRSGVGGVNVYFVPSFFVDPSSFVALRGIDGAFNWNSAWPMGNYNISGDPDVLYTRNLGGRTYMAGISPWFFTHYGPDTYNKNWIYRADDWLFAARWEILIRNRASVGIAQVITWNDYGESHYIGPIAGAQPNSQAWTNGFDHQGWLDLMQFYITAFKTGTYPKITRDRIFLWGRLYPANANAPDYIGKPQHWEWTRDYVWAVVLLASPATVSMSCGSSTKTAFLPAGPSKLKLPLSANCQVKAGIWRNNVVALQFSPKGFMFSQSPPSYNFNAFVAASP